MNERKAARTITLNDGTKALYWPAYAVTTNGGHQVTIPARLEVVAECGCEIVGWNAQGKPLSACKVQNFQYYGGRCAADEVTR